MENDKMAMGSLLNGIAKKIGFGGADEVLRTEGEIKEWMTRRLAKQLKVDPASIDTSRRFDEYGLDSRTAVAVSGELEKLVEKRLSPALLIEHPNIDAVCAELSQELASEARVEG
jgi:acyl carrier protein